MEWNDVVLRLTDVPNAYTRPGNLYTWWQNSLTAGLVVSTNAADGINNQLNFSSASGNWLDVWGQLFNIPRNSNEIDSAYFVRIQFLLNSGRGTANAIQQYTQNGLGYANAVTENFASCSWSMTLQQSLTVAQYTQIAQNLVNVRPAGVPFLPFMILSGGLYLGTINYLGAQSVTGAYLGDAATAENPMISTFTDPSQPTLPTTYLTDPTINA